MIRETLGLRAAARDGMLDIELDADGRIRLAGRLDSAQCDKARRFLDGLEAPRTIDCAGLEFISSAGLGVLLVLQKRVVQSGDTITLVNVNSNIRDVLRHTGLEAFFGLEAR